MNKLTFKDPQDWKTALNTEEKREMYTTFDNEMPEEHKAFAEVCERPQLKGPYDCQIVANLLTQSDRYKNIKPLVLFKILGTRSNYSYLKNLAVSRLETNLKQQFEILRKMTEPNGKIPKPSHELSHNIFSWSWNDFLARRKLKNFVWVDVFLKTDENCLHFFKFQKDLESLQLYVEKIFDGFFSNMGDEDIDLYQHIEKPIKESKKFLHTADNVEKELYINSNELKHLLYKEKFFGNIKRHSEHKFLKAHLENRIWNSHIWDPIEVRYHLNWFHNIFNQNQYHMDKALEKCQTDIVHNKRLFDLETFISGNCMDYCYSSIEVYQNRINEIQEKFDKELDVIENKLTYKRIQIDKLRDQRKWLSEEIERFHEEEEKMRIRNEMENEKILLNELNAKDLPAKKKSKKKGKKSNK